MEVLMGFDNKTKDQLFESLGSTVDGLTSDEAARRRRKYGPNQLVFHRAKSPLIMLLEEFKGMFPMLLLVSAILCFFANTLSPYASGISISTVIKSRHETAKPNNLWQNGLFQSRS